MEWSLSKVIRIENGDVSIAPNDLRPLLSLLGIKDRARVNELVVEAKIARTRQRRAWYQDQEYRENLTDGTLRLIEYEAEAAAMHSYSVFHFPGLLQIPEYSRALIATWGDEISEAQREHRLEARRLRRDTLLQRLGTMRLTALLDESVFRRPIGGREVFAEQLREILRLNVPRLTVIRMVPFSIDAALSYNALFDIMFLDKDGDVSSAVMYRETGTTDEIVEDRTITARHYARYQKLWDAAMTEVETNNFIKHRLESLDQP
jgi:hypothetical protein